MAVEGEPGIGKSRLLAELRARAEANGDVVLAGAGAEFERDRPYGVWVDALDAYAASQAIEDRDLAGVLPSIGGEAPGGDERHRVHRAVGRLLAELAPLLLVLDDLHWADDASTELLGSLVRRGLAPGVQLALGYRTGRASPRLSATLAAPSVQVIELSTLSEHECRTLAGDLAPARHATVFRESGGNPFYALQLARAAPAAHSSSSDRVASGSGVPRSVAAALVGELEALSAPARALLDAGAIAGDPFDPELAYEIAGLDADAGVTALDELLDTRLLHVTSVPRRFAFRHPLVRRAVYESTGGGWRLVAHERAAAALAARGAAAASRAHHVEQSAVQGDAAAIAVLLEAASATAPRAPATAARWFEAALRLQPEADAAARVQTLVALAQAQRSTGDLAHCAARLIEAIDLLGPGETDMRVTLVAATAAAEHFLGRHETADRRLAVALETLPERDSEAAVTVLLAQIAGAFFTLDVDGGLRDGRGGPRDRAAPRRSAADRVDGGRPRARVRERRRHARCRRRARARRAADRRRRRRRARAPPRIRQPAGLVGAHDRARRGLDPPRGAWHRRRAGDRPRPVRADPLQRAGRLAGAARRAGQGRARSWTRRWRRPSSRPTATSRRGC